MEGGRRNKEGPTSAGAGMNGGKAEGREGGREVGRRVEDQKTRQQNDRRRDPNAEDKDTMVEVGGKRLKEREREGESERERVETVEEMGAGGRMMEQKGTRRNRTERDRTEYDVSHQ